MSTKCHSDLRNSAPTVSVIMPCWNGGRFLAEAIDSVVAQTWRDWELIIVDDASSDSSASVAETYCSRNRDRLRLVRHGGPRNLGASAARNLGISRSGGRYIALLDADDVWLPNKLEQQLAILESHAGVDAVFGHSLYWHYEKTVDRNEGCVDDNGLAPNAIIAPPALLAHFVLGKGIMPCPSSIVLRRRLLERIGGFEKAFSPEYGMYEDQAFMAKVFSHGVLYAGDACWNIYRIHNESVCAVSERDGRREAAREFYLRWLYEYAGKQGCLSPRILRWISRRLWRYEHPAMYRVLLPGVNASRAGKRLLGKFAGRGRRPHRSYTAR